MKKFFVSLALMPISFLSIGSFAEPRLNSPGLQCSGIYSVSTSQFTGSLEIDWRGGWIEFEGYPREQLTNIYCANDQVHFTRVLSGGGFQDYTGTLQYDGRGDKSISGNWSGTGGGAPFYANELHNSFGRCFGRYELRTANFVAELNLNPHYSTIQFYGYPEEQIVNLSCDSEVSFTRILNAGGSQNYWGQLNRTPNGDRTIFGNWSGTGGSNSFSAVERY
jgi:hypothetical protein